MLNNIKYSCDFVNGECKMRKIRRRKAFKALSKYSSDGKAAVFTLGFAYLFLIVEIVVLLFRPLVILFSVDCVTPLIVANLLIVISFDLHNSIILNRTASPIFN